jgi:extradiol dioxygenase family protein
MALQPFHVAFPVDDLAAAREFYCGLLSCREGRSSERWIDFDLYGHQVVAHLVKKIDGTPTNPVDGDEVPARHFGVILEMAQWRALAERLEAAGVEFLVAPRVRFRGEPGEQATMFFHDPAGNALEFKAFASDKMIFSR